MQKLQQNKCYTNKQIADWMGITLKTFSNQREKKLKELQAFADYELQGNKIKKIYIKKVYEPYYQKKGSQARQEVRKNYEKYWHDELDTAKRVGEEMYKDGIGNGVKCKTVIAYTGIQKRNDYGVAYGRDGKKGYCVMEWGKYVEENGERYLVPLTEEQVKIKNKLVKKWFGNTTDQHIFVAEMVAEGEITREQAWDMLEELTNVENKLAGFRADFMEAIDADIDKGTRLVQSAFERIEMKQSQ